MSLCQERVVLLATCHKRTRCHLSSTLHLQRWFDVPLRSCIIRTTCAQPAFADATHALSTHIRMPTHIRTQPHGNARRRVHARAPADAPTRAITRTHAYTHARTHTRTRARAQTQTRIRTHCVDAITSSMRARTLRNRGSATTRAVHSGYRLAEPCCSHNIMVSRAVMQSTFMPLCTSSMNLRTYCSTCSAFNSASRASARAHVHMNMRGVDIESQCKAHVQDDCESGRTCQRYYAQVHAARECKRTVSR